MWESTSIIGDPRMRGDARIERSSPTRKLTRLFSRVWTVRDGTAYDGDQSLISLRKGYQETLCSQPLGGMLQAPSRQLAFSETSDSGVVSTIAPCWPHDRKTGYRASGCSDECVTSADHSTNHSHSNKLTRDCPSANEEQD